MKKFILLISALGWIIISFAQQRAMISESERDIAISRTVQKSESAIPKYNPGNSEEIKEIDFESIGKTYYDLQTNRSCQNRIYLFPDGYVGSTFTYGWSFSGGFPDRGTGFNKKEDNDWDSYPDERIESDRTGWPSYVPYGEDGEMVVSHYSGASTDGLAFSYRDEKGAGDWNSFDYNGPDGHNLLWPRMVTSGEDNEYVHLIALTTPVANGGSSYEGQDGALLYSRSSDGGLTWDVENVIIDGLEEDYSLGYGSDTYEFADPVGETIAILVGNDWTDLVLVKSTDNGDTWEKTVIWEHPYPLWDSQNMFETDSFYCPDGAHHLAIDQEGSVHVVFSINRAYSDGGIEYWFPLVGGIGYWNEDMPTFSNDMNALNPYGEEGTELVEDYNFIGWLQDIDENGVIDILDNWAVYYVGSVSHPQIVIDEDNQVFVLFDAMTEFYDNGIYNYRHVWARGSNDKGASWGDFLHVNDDLIYIFSECVFPSCSPVTDDNIHFIFMEDYEPGLAVTGDMHPYTENKIVYGVLPKEDLITYVAGNKLSGVVTGESNGNPVSEALITLEGTGISMTSNILGTYSISGIPAGIYQAICQKAGFMTQWIEVEIYDDENTIQDFELIATSPSDEAIIGNTFYDLQTNYSMQNRIHLFEDGTIGGTWILGIDEPGFPDRGTGYAYYNGIEWDPSSPLTRLESLRTGWPSYSPFGAEGELLVSHDFVAGELILLSRVEKGTGDWTESVFEGPEDFGISWNRTTTSGEDNNTIHVLSLTIPSNNGGATYEGLDGAITYSCSDDGGVNWQQEYVILEGMTSDDYFGFGPDTYEWAAPFGDQIAFLVGSRYTDLFLMKSEDSGETWEKTVIWTHPFPLLDPTEPGTTDAFYCPDGAHSIAFDSDGKLHVVFGITQIYFDGDYYQNEEVDGIAYWNEDIELFSDDMNALSPYDDEGSELSVDTTLVAWSQDVNGNGELDFLDDWGEYHLGVSSMPQLVIDENNHLFLVYSSVTENHDNADQNYRHLWARGYNYLTQSWGEFIDLNSDIIYIFSECVFPSCATNSDDRIHLIFQEDVEPGLAVSGDMDPYGDNNLRYDYVLKTELLGILDWGNLTGTVADVYTGDPVQGADLIIMQTTYSTSSETDGSYAFIEIPSGTYTLQCSKAGYYVESVEFEIEAGQLSQLDILLIPSGTTSEEVIGTTYYDLQSNGSMSNRIFLHDDNTVGAVWTMGFDDQSFNDRGTGYNYYDGNSWGVMPTERIEDDRVGWPSYTPWGENGEIAVGHYSGAEIDGLAISSRTEKGTGDWSIVDFNVSVSSDFYLWPRAVTGGVDHNDLHIIAVTAPVVNGGSIYAEMDGALLYSRSPDGGLTWDYEHLLLDEINSDYYLGFSGDRYEIQTSGDLVAFLAGGPWTDLVLMKSLDNGDTWTKTIVWEHPYPFLDDETITETFYWVDGAHSLAFDQLGNVHIAFGIGKGQIEFGGLIFDPDVDGIGYWNEDMPTFSNELNALNPMGGTGSEMIEDYNLVGWSQDIDENGELDLMDGWGWYYGIGISSMPQLVIDEFNRIFLVYSSVTEGYDNGYMNYRHLWARSSPDNGTSWGSFIHLTSDLTYIFSECVFPSCSPASNDEIHLVFQEDSEPGMAVSGDEHPYLENNIVYMHILKTDPIPNTGYLSGVVEDTDSGSPVEGAVVHINDSGSEDVTVEDGSYFIGQLLEGDYSVSCSAMGYYTEEESITIVANEMTELDFALAWGDDLYPPQNLEVEVSGMDAILQWDSPGSGTPISYIIYKNNEFLTNVTGLDYTDAELEPGEYTYFITANYVAGESLPSNSVTIFSYAPCDAPENLEAIVMNENDIQLTWDEVSGSNVVGYNIYENNSLIQYVTTPGAYFFGMDPGTYEYCITTVCDDGESEETCADELIIGPYLPPPTNLGAFFDVSVLLEWDAPEEAEPSGYNVYDNLNNGGFIQTGYTELTNLTFEDPETGDHEYYVTAVYDEGESGPSNTVSIIITGVGGTKKSRVSLFPNPASQKVMIESDHEIIRISIYDLFGEELIEKSPNDSNILMDIESLDPGLYLFQIELKNSTLVERIIIQ